LEIFGAVMAKNDGHAYKILEDLQREYILDCFDVNGEVHDYEIDGLEAFVDNEGYLTFEEDMGGKTIRDFISVLPGYKLFLFTADYTED